MPSGQKIDSHQPTIGIWRALWASGLVAVLLLACRIGPQPSIPAPTETAPINAQGMATASPTTTATPSPTVPPPPSSTASRPTPTLSPATPTPLPPTPNAGPLPAPWFEIAFGPTPNPVFPTEIALDREAGQGYVLSRCQDMPGQACATAYDLRQDQVQATAPISGSYYAKLYLAGHTLYAHNAGAGELYALDRATLGVRQVITGIYGLAYDGQGTTYIATDKGLTRLGSEAPPQPIERTYDDEPVAMVATQDRVYVLGYASLQVLDSDLTKMDTYPLEESQLRAMALDQRGERLYVSSYDGLYVLDTATRTYQKTPAEVASMRAMTLAEDGSRLFAITNRSNWFGGTDIVSIDTETWHIETLYSTLDGQIPSLALDVPRQRLLLVSQNDHALIAIDLRSGQIAPRLPIGTQPVEVITDPEHNQLFVTDSAGWIHVLDRHTYAPLQRLYGGRHISLDAKAEKLYAGDARLSQVQAFDLNTLKSVQAFPQPGKPRANPAQGEVIIVNRHFYVFDGETGAQREDLVPGIGDPAEECPGCYYPIATDVVIDARRGLTATTIYMPRPGKPGARESIDYDPLTGRAYYSLLTGGYVYFSSISVYPDLGQLQAKAQPVLRLGGLSGFLALDPAARRLYVTRGRFLHILDSETLYQVGRIDLETWTPEILGVDADLGRLYAAHGPRLAVWTRRGGEIPPPQPHEPAVMTGTVSALYVSPAYARDQTLLATVGGKLCRSTDGGQSWVRLRGGLPELGEYVPTVHVAFSPAFGEDHTLFYSAFLGETHGEGVYRSTDGGETWQPSSDGLYDLRIHRVVPSPRYAVDATVLAYAHIQQGQALYRSTDGGTQWSLVVRQTSYNTPTLPLPVEILDIADPPPQFKCQYQGTAGRIVCQRSADGGRTWQEMDTGLHPTRRLVGYALSPHYDQDHLVYLLTEDALYRYDDAANRAEVCVDAVLSGPRDYTNYLTAIGAGATGSNAHLLFIGSTDGQLRKFDPEALDWEPAWPLSQAAPAPTAAPAVTATPCAIEIDERFDIDYTKNTPPLGCATGGAIETAGAYQPFELGMMFWREDARAIYVLRQDGTWSEWQDTWQEGMPAHDPTLHPPEGLYQPVRGFGQVWREGLGGPKAWIGWATAEEQSGGLIVQPGAQGLLLRGINGVTYGLYGDGTWQSLGPP